MKMNKVYAILSLFYILLIKPLLCYNIQILYFVKIVKVTEILKFILNVSKYLIETIPTRVY